MPLAKEIVVDRDENGAPRITIDGVVLPWWTLEGSIKPSVPSLKGTPMLTVTFIADKLTMIDDPNQPYECVSCGKPSYPGYRNVYGQWFCWPCADGESPEAKAAVAQSVADASEPTPDGG